jgi:hypothetical protein
MRSRPARRTKKKVNFIHPAAAGDLASGVRSRVYNLYMHNLSVLSSTLSAEIKTATWRWRARICLKKHSAHCNSLKDYRVHYCWATHVSKTGHCCKTTSRNGVVKCLIRKKKPIVQKCGISRETVDKPPSGLTEMP